MKTTLLVIAILGALTLPAAGQKIGLNDEIRLGRETRQMIEDEFALSSDEFLVARVRQIGNDLTPRVKRREITWQFNVIRMPSWNALALPGGWVYVDENYARKCLAEDPSGSRLAGIIAHEIDHVDERHGARGVENYIKRGGWLLAASILARAVTKDKTVYDVVNIGGSLVATHEGLRYGRGHESDADKGGVQLLVASGKYNPYGLSEALAMLEHAPKGNSSESKAAHLVATLGFNFSSHPALKERIRKTAEYARAAGYVGAAAWRPSAQARLDLSQPVAQETIAPLAFFVNKVEFDNFPYHSERTFREEFKNTALRIGGIEVVWNEDFDDVTAAQDRLDQSGRYEKGEPVTGNLKRPTEMWNVTVSTWEKSRGRRASGPLPGLGRADVEVEEIEVLTRLVFNPMALKAGTHLPSGFTVNGKATRKVIHIDAASQSSGWFRFGRDVLTYEQWEREGRDAAARESWDNAVRSWVVQMRPASPLPKKTGQLTIDTPQPRQLTLTLEGVMSAGRVMAKGDRLERSTTSETPIGPPITLEVPVAINQGETTPKVGDVYHVLREGALIGTFVVKSVVPR